MQKMTLHADELCLVESIFYTNSPFYGLDDDDSIGVEVNCCCTTLPSTLSSCVWHLVLYAYHCMMLKER